MNLSLEEQIRYKSQISINEVSIQGQLKLKQAKILIIGLGGLGCPVAIQLVAAGIGTIGLVEGDKIELSNLSRQILYQTKDIGEYKIEKASEYLKKLNPTININCYNKFFDPTNASDLIQNYDIIIDCTDNFASRYLINESCFSAKKPLISGSVRKFEGRVMVFNQRSCLCCLYEESSTNNKSYSCAEEGIINMVTGITASLQAVEAIKLILEIGNTLISKLLLFDTFSLHYKIIKLNKNENCPLCSSKEIIDKIRSDNVITKDFICTADDLKTLLESNYYPIIIDIRSHEEYISSHIKGAEFIPQYKIYNDIDAFKSYKNNLIIIYCHHGYRSTEIVKFLHEQGIKNVRSLKGGISAYKRAGYL